MASVMATIRMVRRRIARGFMPWTLEGLIEQRGSIEEAAKDLSTFGECTYDEALTALREVYGDG